MFQNLNISTFLIIAFWRISTFRQPGGVRELETYEYQIKAVHSVNNHFKGCVMLSV